MSRQCGSRQAGGAYAVVPLGPDGSPLESFLVCPPIIPDNKIQEGLSSIGVKLMPRVYEYSLCTVCEGKGKQLSADASRASSAAAMADDKITVEETDLENCFMCEGTGRLTDWHIFDVVGKDNYTVASFIEEVRALGVSRRCELNAAQYRLITQHSRLILLHPQAWIENGEEYHEVMRAGAPLKSRGPEAQFFKCPHQNAEHYPTYRGERFTHCLGLAYHDLELADDCQPVGYALDRTNILRVEGEPVPSDRFAWHNLACGAFYQGWLRHEDIKPDYKLAIFASFPLHHFEVIRDPEENKHEIKLDRLANCALGVEVMDE